MLGERMPGLEELLKLREGLCPLASPMTFSLLLLFSRSFLSKFFRLGTRLRKTYGLYEGLRASATDSPPPLMYFLRIK